MLTIPHALTKSPTILLLAACLSGCSKHEPAPPAVAPATGALATGALATIPSPSDGDPSLTSAEYIKLGFPQLDQPWSASETYRAFKVLEDIAVQDARRLPRYRSTQSGKVFARITSPDHIEVFKESLLSLKEERMRQLTVCGLNLGRIGSLYQLHLPDSHQAEKVEFMGAHFRNGNTCLDILEKSLASLAKQDKDYVDLREVLQGERETMSQLIHNALTMIEEADVYPAAERARLAGHMQKTFPDLLPRLFAGDRGRVLQRLEKMASEQGLDDLKKEIESLRDLARTANVQ